MVPKILVARTFAWDVCHIAVVGPPK